MKALTLLPWIVAGVAVALASSLSAAEPKFKVLVLAEASGHHIEFTKAARPWLEKCGQEEGFEVDYISSTAPLTEEYLAKYRVVLQLDMAPYGWKPEAQAAFQSYIEKGKGGWVGLHHASLLGDFDGYKMWPWFSDFLGKIKYKNYIATFASGTVHVEDKSHPCMKGVPETFVVAHEEWYTYDRSPRSNVQVLANVDESSYEPASTVKMGDHPVVWANPHVAARNVYIFMGHGPELLENKAFTTILRNAIVWAAEKPTASSATATQGQAAAKPTELSATATQGQAAAPAFRVLGFYNPKVEAAHASFSAEANRWFPKMAAQEGFAYESTEDWSKMNRENLARYDVVVFLDSRTEVPAQREAFRDYMEHGGGWMGFHFAAFAMNNSGVKQDWDWYHNEFLGSGEYAGNTWRPTSAILKVEDKTHPVVQGLPETYKAPPNEWYKWSKDLHKNPNIKILLSIDPASFPLGTGPKPNEIWHDGYYPMVWTNTKYRMVYFNMGHNDIDSTKPKDQQFSSSFSSDAQSKLILNAVKWLGKRKPAAPATPAAPAGGKSADTSTPK